MVTQSHLSVYNGNRPTKEKYRFDHGLPVVVGDAFVYTKSTSDKLQTDQVVMHQPSLLCPVLKVLPRESMRPSRFLKP